MKDGLSKMSNKVLFNLYKLYLEKLSKTNDRENSKKFILNPFENDILNDPFFHHLTM